MHVYMCVRVFIVDVNANGVVAGNKGIRVEKRGGNVEGSNHVSTPNMLRTHVSYAQNTNKQQAHTKKQTYNYKLTHTHTYTNCSYSATLTHTRAQARFGEKLIEILNLLGTCAAAK